MSIEHKGNACIDCEMCGNAYKCVSPAVAVVTFDRVTGVLHKNYPSCRAVRSMQTTDECPHFVPHVKPKQE